MPKLKVRACKSLNLVSRSLLLGSSLNILVFLEKLLLCNMVSLSLSSTFKSLVNSSMGSTFVLKADVASKVTSLEKGFFEDMISQVKGIHARTCKGKVYMLVHL